MEVSKMSLKSGRSLAGNRRSKRAGRINIKPYGFCCSVDKQDPESRYRRSGPTQRSFPSLHSLHECPALRIREQIVEPRPRQGRNKDGSKGQRSNSAIKLSLQSVHDTGGGLKLANADQNAIQLMMEIMRNQRQAEYERNMDKWAAIGEKRLKRKFEQKKKYGVPFWYTEFSPQQLNNLKGLEDSLFKDKEEKTTSRTISSLAAIGMITDEIQVESIVIRKLLNKFSRDPIKFLCEIYKAITGNYFEEEKFKPYYVCHERIILSAITFLELPKIILELHKRLPPVVQIKLPIKPTPPLMIRSKKMESPLLETLQLPPNWRLYELQYIEWRKKYLSTPKPLAILPKRTKKEEIKEEIKEEELEKEKKLIEEVEHKNSSIINGTHRKALHNDNEQEKHHEKKRNMELKEDTKNTKVTKLGKTKKDVATKDKRSQKQESVENKENIPEFQMDYLTQNAWTNPPTPCPYKYRQLMKKTGPLKTDDEFFNELKSSERTRNFPSGRENLTPKLQRYLLDIEADFFKMNEDADRLTSEVYKIAKEIFEEPLCNACCSCRQTKKMHQIWHDTKVPHLVIDNVVIDENSKIRVVGATAMHSPAESLSSASEVTAVNNNTKNEIDDSAKIFEPPPDVERNVPPCECKKEECDKIEAKPIHKVKDENLCYGKKFRPNEGPAYACEDFNKKIEIKDDDCGCGDEEKCVEDECGCGDDFQKCVDEDADKIDCEISNEDFLVIKDEDDDSSQIKEDSGMTRICKSCGRKLRRECAETDIKSTKKVEKNVFVKCTCDSLTEFLQIDITQVKCTKPSKEQYKLKLTQDYNSLSKSDSKVKNKSRLSESTFQKLSGDKLNHDDQETKDKKFNIRKSLTSDKKEEAELNKENKKIKESKEKGKRKLSKKDLADEAFTIIDTSTPENVVEGGPYGERTASEKALPPVHTVAYLVDCHPPEYPADQIPVRPGGRPCRCRENRNNRKKLLYQIGGLIGDKNARSKVADSSRLIEGIAWLTPEPSIRRSDEYIPEYELYDSPYDALLCGGLKSNKPALNPCEVMDESDEKIEKEGEGESEDAENARNKELQKTMKDPYLTEFFSKKRDKIPCWLKCGKYKRKSEPRKLKVMKPVCECMYERKIVKRNEERKKWHDRQQRLKSFKKESIFHVTGISMNVNSKRLDSETAEEQTNFLETSKCTCGPIENNRMDPIMVISSITMQTPFATPVESRAHCALPQSLVNDENKTTNEKSTTENAAVNNDAVSEKSETKKKSNKNTAKDKKSQEKNLEQKNDNEEVIERMENTSLNDDKSVNKVENAEIEPIENKNNDKEKERLSVSRLEKKLTNQMRRELEKMKNEDFVSVKLPHFYKMPQLSYWISYRVEGMCFTEKYKKESINDSIKMWRTTEKTIKREIQPKLFEISRKERDKINFGKARYWKRKIKNLKLQFYTALRREIVNIGCDMWRTMEFGRFPNLLFKQAYFTYMPPREKDAYVFHPCSF